MSAGGSSTTSAAAAARYHQRQYRERRERVQRRVICRVLVAHPKSSSSGFVTIDSLGQLEIVSGFAEADATKIAVGEPATITFPALTNVDVAGKVVAVSSTSTVVSNVVTYDETIAHVNPPSGTRTE